MRTNGIVLLALCLTATLLRADTLRLSVNGASDYKIVISRQAVDSIHQPEVSAAASELADFLERITGARFSITNAIDARGEHLIIVGRNRLSEALDPAIDWDALGDEGFVIRTVGEKLIIAGGSRRGAMNGVYTFLTDIVGCRWFTPTLSVIPDKPTLAVPALNLQKVPVFEARLVNLPSATDDLWFVRNRLNYYASVQYAPTPPRIEHEPKRAGGFQYAGGFVHTLHGGLVPGAAFDEHPEYFAMANGERVRGGWACLTNAGGLVTDNAKKWIEQAHGRLGRENRRWMVSVSQGDGGNMCGCPPCEAAYAEYGKGDKWMGKTHHLMQLVNEVAGKLEKDYPEALVDTLAYSWTRKPPQGLTMHKNVVVRYAPLWACHYHAFNDENCFRNASRRVHQNLLGWIKTAPRVWVWYYSLSVCNLHPYPDLVNASRNFKVMRDAGVKGIFVQGAEYGTGPVVGGLAELRAYLFARLMWDPDYDINKGIEEFCAASYGNGAAQMISYIKQVQDSATYTTQGIQENYQRIWGMTYTPQELPGFHLTHFARRPIKKSKLHELDALFDEVQLTVADDPEALQSIKLVRLSLQYAIMLHADKDDPLLEKAIREFFPVARLAGKGGLQSRKTGAAQGLGQFEQEIRAFVESSDQ